MIDRLFLRYRNTFTIHFQIIQLIEHLEAGIEQRILWQNRFSYVAAFASHAFNKVPPARFQVNHLLKIPGIDLVIFPNDPTVLRSAIQRTNVVRNSEAEHPVDLFRFC